MNVGDRIYYTGDMANHEGYGHITEAAPRDKWGAGQLHVTLDDGRDFWVYRSAFSPGPGRRFWLAVDWEADRQRRIAEMCERMAVRGIR